MRLWRFQAALPAVGDSNEQGSGLLPASPANAAAVRQVGVFRIYREALTGPVAESGSEDELAQFLDQFKSMMQSSGSQ